MNSLLVPIVVVLLAYRCLIILVYWYPCESVNVYACMY
jgi:hypothetical protein